MKWREIFSDIIGRKRRILIVSFLDCIQKKSMGKQGKRAGGRQPEIHR
jgi:hypothetical protein